MPSMKVLLSSIMYSIAAKVSALLMATFVFLVHHLPAETAQQVARPGHGVTGCMAEREPRRVAALRQLLAHLQLAVEVGRERIIARLLHPGDAVVEQRAARAEGKPGPAAFIRPAVDAAVAAVMTILFILWTAHWRSEATAFDPAINSSQYCLDGVLLSLLYVS